MSAAKIFLLTFSNTLKGLCEEKTDFFAARKHILYYLYANQDTKYEKW